MSSQYISGESALLDPVRELGIVRDGEVEFVRYVDNTLPTAPITDLLKSGLPQDGGFPEALSYARQLFPGVPLTELSDIGSTGVILQDEAGKLVFEVPRHEGMPSRWHSQMRAVRCLGELGIGPVARLYVDVPREYKREPAKTPPRVMFRDTPIPRVTREGRLPVLIMDKVDFVNFHEPSDAALGQTLGFAFAQLLEHRIAIDDSDLGIDIHGRTMIIDGGQVAKSAPGVPFDVLISCGDQWDGLAGTALQKAQITSTFLRAIDKGYREENATLMIEAEEYGDLINVAKLIGDGGKTAQADVIGYVLECRRQAKAGNVISIEDYIETCLRPRRLPVVITPGGIAVARIVEPLPATSFVNFEVNQGPQNPCRRPLSSNHPFNW